MDSLLWNLSTGRLMPLTLLKSLADFHREVKSIFGFFSVEAKGQVLTFCQVAEYVLVRLVLRLVVVVTLLSFLLVIFLLKSIFQKVMVSYLALLVQEGLWRKYVC